MFARTSRSKSHASARDTLHGSHGAPNRYNIVFVVLFILAIIPTAPLSASNMFNETNVARAAERSTNATAIWDEQFSTAGIQGTVYALATDGQGSLYIGGQFFSSSARTSNIARWDGYRWSPLATGVDGTVTSLAVDRRGIVYAGGSFTTAGGVQANRIARWDPTTKVWAALGSGMNDSVGALVIDRQDRLYAGGTFTTADGISAYHIAQWDPVAEGWTRLGKGVNGGVRALALGQDNSIYVGGTFTTAGTTMTGNIARWNPTLRTWAPLGAGVNNWISELVVDGQGRLVVAGAFTRAGGGPANYVAVWNGSKWAPLGSGVDDVVYALAVDQDGMVFVGGEFSEAGGTSAAYTALWNGTSWGNLYYDIMSAAPTYELLALSNGMVYAGGTFATASGNIIDGLALWYRHGWSFVGNGLNDAAMDLAMDKQGHVYAGGSFRVAGGQRVDHIASWDTALMRWSPLGTGRSAPVTALATGQSGVLYAASGTSGQVTVARWDGTTWQELGNNFNGEVKELVVDDHGNVYAGGTFTSVGSVRAARIARWNPATRTWSAVGAGMNNAVHTLALDPNGNLYAGGSFTTAGGTSAKNIARWDGTRWWALGVGLGGKAFSLAVDIDGGLYVGGQFATAGGKSAQNIARWNGSSWSVVGSPIWTTSSSFVSSVTTDGRGGLYAAGPWVSPDGTLVVEQLQYWDGNEWENLGGGTAGTYAMVADHLGDLYAAGSFTELDQTRSLYIGRHAYSPTISVADIVLPEGASGTTPARLELRLSAPSTREIKVTYGTADGMATVGADYSARSGTVTFPPGTTRRIISFPIIGDTRDEVNESVLINFGNPVNATLSTRQVVAVITDDDGPSLSIIDAPSVLERSTSTAPNYAKFTVRLSTRSVQGITVQFATANGTAIAGKDFFARANILRFPPGTTEMVIAVRIKDDTEVEELETLQVTLTQAVDATLSDGQGLGFIADDD